MTQKEILSSLCYRDTRNPLGVSSYLTQEEIEEEGHTDKAKENCHCDNCFYGKTKLAEYILKLQEDGKNRNNL